MPKRKRSGKGSVAEATSTVETVALAPLPSAKQRIGVSVLVCLHFSALIIALSANLAPSFLHGELLAWLAPLHVSTGQDYILLPLELTHADEIEAPLVIEAKRSKDGAWAPLQLTADEAQGAFNTRWQNASRLLCWIAIQQPESEVLPEFAARVVRRSESVTSTGEDAITAIRFFQPHVLSFDEDLLVEQGQGSFISDSLNGEVVYAADIVRSADGEIGLVPMQDSPLTSKSIASQPSTPPSAEESSAP